MRKIILSTVCVVVMLSTVLALAACGWAPEKVPTDEKFIYNENEWNTVFYDDFKGDSLDLTKWRINTMTSDNGVRRAGYYVDDSDIVFVNNDNLTIRTKYKNGKYGDGWYTSWLETSTKERDEIDNPDYEGFSANGGYFEIKCKAPRSKGIWSAFWLMPDEGVAFTDEDVQWSGSDGTEIDIMESFGWSYGKSDVTHVIHGDGFNETLKTAKSKTFRLDDMYDTYHTYALEWTKDKYIFYIDGNKTWETAYEYQGKVMGVSDVLEYMILSIEVAGENDGNGKLFPGKQYGANNKLVPHWAGNPMDNDTSKGYDFIIDYVKVMQRK